MPCFRGWIFERSIREQVREVDALFQGMDCQVREIDKKDNRKEGTILGVKSRGWFLL